jgi:hypothetical protein
MYHFLILNINFFNTITHDITFENNHNIYKLKYYEQLHIMIVEHMFQTFNFKPTPKFLN